MYDEVRLNTTTCKQTTQSTSSQDEDSKARSNNRDHRQAQTNPLQDTWELRDAICFLCSGNLNELDKNDYVDHIMSCLDLIVSNGLPSCTSTSKVYGVKNMKCCPVCRNASITFSTKSVVERAKHIRRCASINNLHPWATWEKCRNYWVAENSNKSSSPLSSPSKEHQVERESGPKTSETPSRPSLSLAKGKQKYTPKTKRNNDNDNNSPVILIINDSEDDASDKESTYSQELDDIRNAHTEKSAFNIVTYHDNSPTSPKLGDKRPLSLSTLELEQPDGDKEESVDEKRICTGKVVAPSSNDASTDRQQHWDLADDIDEAEGDLKDYQDDITADDGRLLGMMLIGELDNNVNPASSQGNLLEDDLQSYAIKISSDYTLRQATLRYLEKVLFASKEDSNALLCAKRADAKDECILKQSEVDFMRKLAQDMQNEEKRIGLYWVYEEYSKTKCDQAAVQRLTELDHRFAPALCIMGFLAENILDSGTDNANVEVISISSEPSQTIDDEDIQAEATLQQFSSSLSLYDLTEAAQLQSPFGSCNDLADSAQQSYGDSQKFTTISMHSSQASLEANDIPDIFFSLEAGMSVRAELGNSEIDPIEISDSSSSDSNPDVEPQRPQQATPLLPSGPSSPKVTQTKQRQRISRVRKMPDYQNMTEPQLKQHCDRVGLKYQGRKITVPMLEMAWRHQHPSSEEYM